VKKIVALTLAVLLAACGVDFHDDGGRPVTSDVILEVGE
jgi:hypothetical protein